MMRLGRKMYVFEMDQEWLESNRLTSEIEKDEFCDMY